MTTKVLFSLSCTMSELPEFIAQYHKEYGSVPGTEISIRYGTDHNHINPNKTCCVVYVSRTEEKSLYRGSHSQYYHQEMIPAE